MRDIFLYEVVHLRVSKKCIALCVQQIVTIQGSYKGIFGKTISCFSVICTTVVFLETWSSLAYWSHWEDLTIGEMKYQLSNNSSPFPVSFIRRLGWSCCMPLGKSICFPCEQECLIPTCLVWNGSSWNHCKRGIWRETGWSLWRPSSKLLFSTPNSPTHGWKTPVWVTLADRPNYNILLPLLNFLTWFTVPAPDVVLGGFRVSMCAYLCQSSTYRSNKTMKPVLFSVFSLSLFPSSFFPQCASVWVWSIFGVFFWWWFLFWEGKVCGVPFFLIDVAEFVLQ